MIVSERLSGTQSGYTPKQIDDLESINRRLEYHCELTGVYADSNACLVLHLGNYSRNLFKGATEDISTSRLEQLL